MIDPQLDFAPVREEKEVEALLAVLSKPGGASLMLEDSDGKPLPVLVAGQQPGEHLLLDFKAIPEVAVALKKGAAFRLIGQSDGMVMKTPPLWLEDCGERQGRLEGHCAYPEYLEVCQRRASFRAKLRMSMEVKATLRVPSDSVVVEGGLKDLSLEGCQLELPLTAASRLASPQPPEIELHFPNDTRFRITAAPRHHVVDTGQQIVRAGFQFVSPSADQERQLWYFVCEIERESARYSGETGKTKLPSLLFQPAPVSASPVVQQSTMPYATPMANRLARVAGYLGGELVALQQGRTLNPSQLSRHADRVLSLHDEDREALLFATRCLIHEPREVRHGLAVAVYLLDLSATRNMPRDVRKAVVASAMVHDLGKALLPRELTEAASLDTAQRAELRTHVETLMQRLERCQWLAAGIRTAIVERINERRDGSGYPLGLAGEQLGELTRLAMVVDVVDAMRRDRPDRAAWKVADIYRHLLGQPAFDPRWVKRYIKHFGLLPIGSLVRFEGGQLAWVEGLGEHGELSRVRLTDEVAPPGKPLGKSVSGKMLERLGAVSEEVPVST